jgi:Tol biopolymer transport system component
LVTTDRQGHTTTIGAPARSYRSHVALSPDGRQLGLSVQTAAGIQAYAYDITRGILTRLGESLNGEVTFSAWSRSGAVAMQVVADGRIQAVVVPPGSGTPATIVPESIGFWAAAMSPRNAIAGLRDGDVWVYPPIGVAGSPVRILHPSAEERQSGRDEVYVQPYPGPGPAIAVSAEGGASPLWSPAGDELFFVESGPGGDRLMSLDVRTPSQPGKPRPLFTLAADGFMHSAGILTSFDVSPDGQRFYGVRLGPAPLPRITTISLVLNLFDVIKTKTAAAR